MPGELSPLITYASGSAGDVVASRNQHGPYLRARTTPTDPSTPRQDRVRFRWALVADRWVRILTSDQRKLWNDYAAQRVVHSSRLRETRLSGQQAYQRANYSRVTRALGFVDEPPTTYADPIWTTPFDVIDTRGGVILFSIDNTDEWANTDLSALVTFVSNGRPSTVNFHKTPFRRARVIRGFEATPPAVTHAMPDPWGNPGADRRWFRTLVFLGDGRVSSPRILPFDSNL